MYSISKKKSQNNIYIDINAAWLEVPACISHYADIGTHFKSMYKVQKIIDAQGP